MFVLLHWFFFFRDSSIFGSPLLISYLYRLLARCKFTFVGLSSLLSFLPFISLFFLWCLYSLVFLLFLKWFFFLLLIFSCVCQGHCLVTMSGSNLMLNEYFWLKKYNYFFLTALYFIFLGINCCLFQLHSCLAILFQSSFSTLCAFLKALIAFLMSCSLVWRVRLEFSSALCLHFSGVLSKYFSPIFFCNTLCG